MQELQSTFQFLKELKKNNHREWFTEHKNRFQEQEKQLKYFLEDITEGLLAFDAVEKVKIFRIYKDVRFSKDKTPYKTNRSARWGREGAERRGSYYMQLEPGNSFVSGGFFQPNTEDLLRIRKAFAHDSKPIRDILAATNFKKAFDGFVPYDQVKTAPRGFEIDHPDMDLIRNKSFFVTHYFSDAEVLDSAFKENVLKHFRLLLPFFDYMSHLLTTDANGVSLLSD